MQLDKILLSRRQEFIGLCKSHDVIKLFAFGSVVTNQFDEEKRHIEPLKTEETALLETEV